MGAKISVGLGIVVLFVLSLSNNAQGKPTEKDRQADSTMVGFYLEALDNIKLSEGTCYMELWVWADYDKSYFDKLGISPLEELRVRNCEEVRTDGPPEHIAKPSSEKAWALQKYRLEMYQDWEARRFPLDTQQVVLQFEVPEYHEGKMAVGIDHQNSLVAPAVYDFLRHHGWHMVPGSVRMEVERKELASNLGNIFTNKKHSAHSLITLKFTIDRKGSMVFMKIFLTMYISVFIALLIFMLDKELVDARMSLIIGGLFGAIGNKYIIDSEIPHSPVLTLTDTLHNLSYIYLFLTLFAVILEYQRRHKIKRMSKKQFQAANLSIFAFFLITYGVLNYLLVRYW